MNNNDELTAKQEELLLEQAREEYYEKKYERAEVLFDEWLSINISGLQKDFSEDNKEEFLDYCKEGYKQECERLI
jgi:hypothetical protein